MIDGERLLISYYGDDFTGSTDVMEVLERAGVPTVLYLRPPTRDDLAGDSTIRAVGLAGMSRTMSIDVMDDSLPEAFRAMRALGAATFHYKICSTFDSSPTIGSIGRAIEIARRTFGATTMPMVVGSPDLGRYCVFGEIYASTDGRVHRLDRHPTLPSHPVTPMREADILRHLSLQTDLPATRFELTALEASPAGRAQRYDEVLGEGPAVVLFDVLNAEHLASIGELIWSHPGGPTPVAIGSSGVESALVAHWRGVGELEGTPTPNVAPEAAAVLVLSGSCAAATGAQVQSSMAMGHTAVRLDADAAQDEAGIQRLADRACRSLEEAKSFVVYTAVGPDDCGGPLDAAHFGDALAGIAERVVSRLRPERMVVAGGDTSGRVARRLDIDALRFLAPIALGAPLCRAASTDPRIDGLEIALKGGQVGQPAYFEQVRLGRA